MGFITILMVILCVFLPSLLCDSKSKEEHVKRWKKVDVLEDDESQYRVGCGPPYLMAPGYSTYHIKREISSSTQLRLRDFYLNCIGNSECNVSKNFIIEVRSLTRVPAGHHLLLQLSKDIIICLLEEHFTELDSSEHVTISEMYHPDYGFILRGPRQQDSGINITIIPGEGQTVALTFYYTDPLFSSKKPEVPISSPGGSWCMDDTDTEEVLLLTELNVKPVLFLPWCAHAGRFVIGYVRFDTHWAPDNMPLDWNFTSERYTLLSLGSFCNYMCPRPMVTPTDPFTNSPNDKSSTEAIYTESVNGAVIGVSVVAGLLLAAILVIVVIFLLWKRNMLSLPLKSAADREAAPTPPKQKADNPSEGAYSQPYDNVRTPDILDNRNGSNGNLYAEVKDRKKSPIVSGSSLHIQENDLYSVSGNRVPQRGPRDSAGVYIVENDGYDSLGTK